MAELTDKLANLYEEVKERPESDYREGYLDAIDYIMSMVEYDDD